MVPREANVFLPSPPSFVTRYSRELLAVEFHGRYYASELVFNQCLPPL
jgi:hypothetical protein